VKNAFFESVFVLGAFGPEKSLEPLYPIGVEVGKFNGQGGRRAALASVSKQPQILRYAQDDRFIECEDLSKPIWQQLQHFREPLAGV
jgi:hypothetical protein